MSSFDRIQDRTARKIRRDAAVAMLMKLSLDDREEVIAEVMALTDKSEKPNQKVATPIASQSDDTDTSFADLAETFVLEHREGVTTRQVADAIGQKPTSADGTLRALWKSRKTLERREGLWFPTARTNPGRVTHRDAIKAVLIEHGAPLGAGDICNAIQTSYPDRKRPSLDAELHRMRTDGLLVERGSNGRGSLYTLSEAQLVKR